MRIVAFVTYCVLATVVLAACGDDDGATSATPTPAPSTTRVVTESKTALQTTLAPSPTVSTDDATLGPAATIELTADPQKLTCDGEQASVVTASVFDAGNRPVDDGTEVRFSVVALGTADPINTVTTDGVAKTSVVALASQAGVVVNVTSGEASASIRVDCQ
jgi:hypothetical protein